MPRNRAPSPQALRVLGALAAVPAGWRYGYDLGAETGLKAGALYLILVRLADRGLLEAAWEQSPPPGRPARYLYRELAVGAALAVVPAPGAPRRRARAGRVIPQPGGA